MRLYEDVSGLSVFDVKTKPGRYGPKDKERIFNCIQTGGGHCTCLFVLRCYSRVNPTKADDIAVGYNIRTYLEHDPKLAASKAKDPYVKKFEFTPNFQGEKDAALLKRLSDYSMVFSSSVTDLPYVYDAIKSAIWGEEEEDEQGN